MDFDPENDDHIIQKGNKMPDITELNRLSYTVSAIDRECAVVPAEAYKNTPNGETIKNIGFTGLKVGQAGTENWRHFRDVRESDRIKRMGNYQIY